MGSTVIVDEINEYPLLLKSEIERLIRVVGHSNFYLILIESKGHIVIIIGIGT